MASGGNSSDLRRRFEAECGPSFFLDPSDPQSLEARLRELRWLPDSAGLLDVRAIAGGNMNLTVRVTLPGSTAVLKQARPWVEKYPHINAPVARGAVEAAFYRYVSRYPLVSRRMPRVLGIDDSSFLLLLEDVPGAADLTSLYTSARLAPTESIELIEYLNSLHSIEVEPEARESFRNREMRALNHAHQYEIPLDPASGLDLDTITPGLNTAAQELRADRTYTAGVRELGRLYLTDGLTLLHGDYFPGSWLRSSRGLIVIDPEFCFLGPAEYDLGILYAHLVFASNEDLWPDLRCRYQHPVDWKLVSCFAAAEIMRRLIGVAQLPLLASIEQKRAWLDLSRTLLCD